MSGDLVLLDSRRSGIERAGARTRRHAPGDAAYDREEWEHLHDLERQMLADPARDWTEVKEQRLFLLESHALAEACADPRIQMLVRRAIADMPRNGSSARDRGDIATDRTCTCPCGSRQS
ncbi:hypothetical protein LA6_003874 [Marinibacterium anthonyi]|nr:hypothetical protein LA6_003874 [Marinibacterium anthonyi]